MTEKGINSARAKWESDPNQEKKCPGDDSTGACFKYTQFLNRRAEWNTQTKRLCVSIVVLNSSLLLANSSFMPARISKMNPNGVKSAKSRGTSRSIVRELKALPFVPAVEKKLPSPSNQRRADRCIAGIAFPSKGRF